MAVWATPRSASLLILSIAILKPSLRLWSVSSYWTGELLVADDFLQLFGSDDLDVGHFVVAEAEETLQESSAVVAREEVPEPASVFGEGDSVLEVRVGLEAA